MNNRHQTEIATNDVLMDISTIFPQEVDKILAQVVSRGFDASVLGGVQSLTVLSNLTKLDMF